MSDSFKSGDWATWGDITIRIHGAEKAGRYLVEYQLPHRPNEYQRAWVSPDRINKLNPAVCSILESIYN